jgi:CheY-like chemotaxis protein
MGHEVTLANNGQQAMDLFEPGKFDLVFMDIQMPVDGWYNSHPKS